MTLVKALPLTELPEKTRLHYVNKATTARCILRVCYLFYPLVVFEYIQFLEFKMINSAKDKKKVYNVPCNQWFIFFNYEYRQLLKFKMINSTKDSTEVSNTYSNQ